MPHAINLGHSCTAVKGKWVKEKGGKVRWGAVVSCQLSEGAGKWKVRKLKNTDVL